MICIDLLMFYVYMPLLLAFFEFVQSIQTWKTYFREINFWPVM